VVVGKVAKAVVDSRNDRDVVLIGGGRGGRAIPPYPAGAIGVKPHDRGTQRIARIIFVGLVAVGVVGALVVETEAVTGFMGGVVRRLLGVATEV
jgi:hypothetical protein